MSSYATAYLLTDPVGNNQFSFWARSDHWATLVVPKIQTIQNSSAITLGNEIVFADIDHLWKMQYCTWLSALYHLPHATPETRVMDNHNHALYARVQHFNKNNTPLVVLHIDAHADLSPSAIPFDYAQKNDPSYLWHFTNAVCTIASFIQPLLDVHIVNTCHQIRTSTVLFERASHPPAVPYVLDLDLDFLALTHTAQDIDEIIHACQLLIHNATLCTIATSPFFLEQERALTLINRLALP